MADADPRAIPAAFLADVRMQAEDHHLVPAAMVLPLVAALEAVLKAHRPNTADGRCNWCREPDGQRSAFPCGEYLTIAAALTGEEAG